ncbi:MAG TPA: CaiB/BaiF CoA-transferase family protein [Chloroflexota bacterium]|nr:CaiB/BaiF CoA-transferase family protein [Chloroflexota bacterium]
MSATAPATRPPAAPGSGALDGLRILEVAGLFGAYCGKLFAELGADVILVEPPGGAPQRRTGPFLDEAPGPDGSLTFAYLHSSKRGVTLDLDTADGQVLFRGLAASAAAVVESAPPGALDARGLGYDALGAPNPALVYTSITPFGREGPYADLPASDLTLMALGGLLCLGGYDDGEPTRAYGDQALRAADQFAAVGTLLAILQAEATGQGQRVDVSAQECVVLALENAIQYYDLEGTVRRRLGAGQRQAGIGVYPCADGHIYLLATTYGQKWDPLVHWLMDAGVKGAEQFLEPRWRTVEWLQQEEAKAIFLEAFLQLTLPRTKAELYAGGVERQLPLCPINTPADVLASPQLAARGYFAAAAHPALDRPLVMPGAPYQLSATPWRLRGPAPTLGQHNAEIYAELGLGPADLAHLRAAAVL